MRKKSPNAAPVILLTAVLFLSSCASAPPPSGFLGDYSRLEEGPRFKSEYKDASVRFTKYRKIKVNPVQTEFFDKEAKFEIGVDQAERLAGIFAMELRDRLAGHYRIVSMSEKPDGETLVLDAALTHAKTPRRLLNVITTLFFAPVSSGSASFEAKLSDGASGEVVARVAEKRTGAWNIKSLLIGPFMKFDHAEAILRKWSGRMADFLQSA